MKKGTVLRMHLLLVCNRYYNKKRDVMVTEIPKLKKITPKNFVIANSTFVDWF